MLCRPSKLGGKDNSSPSPGWERVGVRVFMFSDKNAMNLHPRQARLFLTSGLGFQKQRGQECSVEIHRTWPDFAT
jgi:hypothetical protein